MIFSAKDEDGKSIFDKVVSGQKTVTTRYGVSAEKLLKKWQAYERAKARYWKPPIRYQDKQPEVPLISIQPGRGKKSLGYREIIRVSRRGEWWLGVVSELAKFSSGLGLSINLEGAKSLEAHREGFSSWVYMVKVITAFAKSKGKSFNDGVRIEFSSTNV